MLISLIVLLQSKYVHLTLFKDIFIIYISYNYLYMMITQIYKDYKTH